MLWLHQEGSEFPRKEGVDVLSRAVPDMPRYDGVLRPPQIDGLREMWPPEADTYHLAKALWDWEVRFVYYLTCDIRRVRCLKWDYAQKYGFEALNVIVHDITLQAGRHLQGL